MSVAKRWWEGTLTKNGSEIGFAEGTISVDRNLQTFYELGTYNLVARRTVAPVYEGTIEHGYISKAAFYGTGISETDHTFNVTASMSDHAIRLSGCVISDYEFDLPADGWINESVSISVKVIA